MSIGESCHRLIGKFGLKRVFTLVVQVKDLEDSQGEVLGRLVVLVRRVGVGKAVGSAGFGKQINVTR